MSNELAALSGSIAIPVSQASLKPANRTVERGYASRIQLNHPLSKAVSDLGAKPNEFCIVDGSKVIDLGKSIELIPICRLDKAVDTNANPIEAVFDPESAEFKRIAEDSKTPDSGAMFGPVLLVYELSTGDFYEIFFSSKSGRRSAPDYEAYLPISAEAAEAHGIEPRPLTVIQVDAEVITSQPRGKKKSFSYPVHSVVGPVEDPEFGDNPPTAETLQEVVNNFLKQVEDNAVEEEDRDR